MHLRKQVPRGDQGERERLQARDQEMNTAFPEQATVATSESWHKAGGSERTISSYSSDPSDAAPMMGQDGQCSEERGPFVSVDTDRYQRLLGIQRRSHDAPGARIHSWPTVVDEISPLDVVSSLNHPSPTTVTGQVAAGACVTTSTGIKDGNFSLKQRPAN